MVRLSSLIRKRKASKEIFEKLEEEGIKDPNEIEKRKREELMKKHMSEDNQVQSAISVLKGIRIYKKLTTSEN